MMNIPPGIRTLIITLAAAWVTQAAASAATDSWLNMPWPSFGAGAGQGVAPSAENFPKQASPKQQFALLERLYPYNFNLEGRREAFEKTIQYFPGDGRVRFYATAQLADIDRQEHRYAQAINELNTLLTAYAGKVDRDAETVAEYALGLALWDNGQTADALAVFTRLGGPADVSYAHRAESRFCAALILEDASPQKAIALLSQNIDQHSGTRGQSVALMAELMAKEGEADHMAPILRKFFAEDSPDVGTAIIFLGPALLSLSPDQAAALLKIIDGTAAGTPIADSAPLLLASYRKNVDSVRAYAPLQADLKKYLAGSPPLDYQKLTGPEPTRLASRYFSISLAGIYERSRWTWVAPAAPVMADTDNALRYSMDLLTQPDPDPQFSETLVYAAEIITREAGMEGKTRYGALLAELLSLCDRLPADDVNHDGADVLRGLMADYTGDVHGARKQLEAALKEKLSERARQIAEIYLGHVMGELGDYPGALAHYKAGEPTRVQPWSGPYMLTPVLLNLELGNQKEALRILAVLKDLPPGLNGNSTDPTAELTGMAARGTAVKYWDAAAKWWSAWQVFEAQLGLPPLDPKASLFQEDDLRDSSADFAAAVNADDRVAYLKLIRTIVYHARWTPGAAIWLYLDQSEKFGGIAPELWSGFSQFVLTLSDDFSSDIPSYNRSMIAIRTSCYLVTGQSQEAMDACTQFFAHDSADDHVNQEMIRFQADAALALAQKPAIDTAAAALTKMLNSEEWVEKRIVNVTLLARLYNAEGDKADEQLLLRQELARPDTGEDEDGLSHLKSLYAGLTSQGDPSMEFSGDVARWLAENKPAWYDYAKPADLNEPALQDLGTVVPQWDLEVVQDKRPAAEATKLNFLVAANSNEPLLKRMLSFRYAFVEMLGLCRTNAEVRQLDASIEDLDTLPREAEYDCLEHALLDAAITGNREQAEIINGFPLAKMLPQNLQVEWDSLLTYARMDHSSAEETGKFCGTLESKLMTELDLILTIHCVKDLINMRKFDEATKLLAGLGDCQFDESVPDSGSGEEILRDEELAAAKADEPMNRALMAVVLKYFPGPAPAEEPEVVAALHHPMHPRFVTQADARQVLLYHVRTGRVYDDEIGDWLPLMQNLSFSTDGKACYHEMIHEALKTAPDDTVRATVIEKAMAATDEDTTAERDWLLKELQPYASDGTQKETYAEIKYETVALASFSGPVDPAAALVDINVPRMRSWIEKFELRYYLNTQNLAALKDVVSSELPQELANQMVEYNLPALDALGMTAAAAVERTAARRQLYRGILKSWSGSDSSLTLYLATLADIAGNDPLPGKWLEAIGKSDDEEDKLWVKIQRARARQDWTAEASLSAQAAALPSNENDYTWYQAEALSKAGKKDDAMKMLELYMQRALGEYHYLDASRLLQQLRTNVAGNNR